MMQKNSQGLTPYSSTTRRRTRAEPVLRINALSAMMALVLPTIVSHAFAQSCASGQTLPGSPANSGCAATVTSGSTVTGTIVNSGGKQTISAGGNAISSVVNSGGSQNVAGLGSAATINAGGKQVVSSGGATVSTTIASGGTQTIMAGGTDQLATVLAGGTQTVSGTATSATLNGGKQSVSSGGVASAAVINSGGSQAVVGGGAAVSTVINNGGKQVVSSGGIATGTTITNGGAQAVSSGGVANATVVNSGGVLNVAGGMASGTVVNSGGSASVASGGTATNTVVNAFARQTVTSGLAVNTVLVGAVSSGGTQYVSAGGVTLNTTVGQKARQTVYPGGVANGTQVLSAGTQTVSSGGQANGTTVANGGQQQVVGGGVVSGSIIATGGTAALYVGGATSAGLAPAPVFTSGNVSGTLLITTTSGAVAGNPNAVANALTLSGGSVVFTAPDVAGYKTLTVNGLSGSGQFSLNTNVASGQGDQLVINNGTGNYSLSVQDSSTTPAAKGTRVLLISDANNAATFTLPTGSIDVGAEKFGLQDVGGQYYLYDTGKLGDAASVAQALPAVSTMLWYEQIEQTMSRMAELRGGSDQGLWVHAYGQRFTLDSAGVSSTVDAGGVQFGRDLRFARPYGNWYAGVTGGVAEGRTTVGGSGSAKVYPWNIGLYGGLNAKNGWFSDAVVRFISTSNSLSIVNDINGEYHNSGFAASLEGGRRLALPGDWTVEPRVALSYLHASALDYTLDSGMPIQLAAQNTVLGTAGVTVSKPVTLWGTPMQPFMSVNAVHAFNDQQTVTVAGTNIGAQLPGTWVTLATGLTAALNRSSHFYVGVGYAKGQNYQATVAVNVGLSYQK